ncbi:MAG: CHAT domain-containing protein [Sphingomonas phyllosphaerae]
MGSERYRRELATLTKNIGKLRSEIAKHEEKVLAARSRVARLRASEQRTSSKATKDSYRRQADTDDKKAAAVERVIGTLTANLAELLTKQGQKEESLRIAERTEQKIRDRDADALARKEKAAEMARERAEKTRQANEKALQRRQDRENLRRRRTDLEHAREIGRLSSKTVRHILVRPPEPDLLRILYLTASPVTHGLEHLRVDVEVNHVLKALRSAKHARLIDFQHRPAATVQDLTDGLNDVRPHVVHFSGHAGDGLLFDRADCQGAADQLLRYEAVANLLEATDQRPKLVVLNACDTVRGVERLLEVAPVVIATSDAIGDAASTIFAVNFYAAIAAAQSIGHAADQAREMVASALQLGRDMLTVATAEGVDARAVTLIRPADKPRCKSRKLSTAILLTDTFLKGDNGLSEVQEVKRF